MQKKHQEFFRKLRTLCGEYDVFLEGQEDAFVRICIGKNEECENYDIDLFDGETEIVFKRALIHHSISSEAKDEGEK